MVGECQCVLGWSGVLIDWRRFRGPYGQCLMMPVSEELLLEEFSVHLLSSEKSIYRNV